MKRFPQITGSIDNAYPSEMRRQLWPLCCGASIISGFKTAHNLEEDEIVKQIEETINGYVPDLQVFKGEQICPKLTFLTLNSGQMNSPKIMNAITKAGFVKFGEGSPRGTPQGFFVRDTSKTFKTSAVA